MKTRFVLVATLFCGALRAGEIDFDPARDLSGFADVEKQKLEYQSMFEPERFSALKGRRDAADVERIRKEWNALRTAVLARIAKIESDPYAAAVFSFDKAFQLEIGKHFGAARFGTAEQPPPVAKEGEPKPQPLRLGLEIRFQPKRVEDKLYGPALGKNYGRMAQALFRHFDAEYAVPHDVAPRPDYRPFVALVVVESRDDYERLFIRKTHADPSFVRAHYDPLRRMAFTFESGTGELTHEKQQAVLHEMTHALVDAYRVGGSDGFPLWLGEGFAEYLGHCHGHVESSSIVFGAKPERALHEMFDILTDDEIASVALFRIEDLFSIEEYADAERILSARALEKKRAIRPGFALAMLYRQAHLLVWWLDRGGDDERKTGFRRYLGDELRGKGGVDAFRAAMGVKDLTELDARFLEGIRRVYEQSPAAQPDLATPKPQASKYGTVEVSLSPVGPVEKRGAVFALAKRGELAAAKEAARDAGLSRDELEFVARLDGFVDGVLSGLERNGTAITQRIGDKADKSPDNIQGKVLRHDSENFVILRSTKKQEVTVPRSRFGVVEAIHNAAKAGVDPKTLDLGRVLGLLGEAEPKTLAALGLKAKDVSRFDVPRAELARALDAAFARAELESLIPLANRLSGAEAEAALVRVETLATRFASSDPVSANRGALRALAGQWLERSYASGTRDAVGLEGKLGALPDGRVELRYDFDDPAQLADFEVNDIRPGFMAERPKSPPVAASHVPGAVAMKGYCALAHKARFAGDFEIEYEFQVQTEAVASFSAYYGDLDAAVFALVPFDSDLVVYTGAGLPMSRSLPGAGKMQLQVPQRVLLAQHDGKISASLATGKGVEIARSLRDSNRVLFLTMQSLAEIRVTELVVRGTFDPRWFGKSSATLIETRLAELFPD